MEFLYNAFKELKEYSSLNSITKKKSHIALNGLAGIHKSNTMVSLCHFNDVRAFCVASNENEAQNLVRDMTAMGKRAYFYPSRDFIFNDVSGKSREYEHIRLGVLSKMLLDDYDVIVSCIDGLSQYTIPPEYLSRATLNIKKGESISTEKCVEALVLLGYERADIVEGQGQFSLRGGILDFFRPEDEYPIRIEFWGDDVETICNFEIDSQRRFQTISAVSFSPSTELLVQDKAVLCDKIIQKANRLRSKTSEKAKEIMYREAEEIQQGLHISNLDKYISFIYDKTATVLDYLPPNALVFISEHNSVNERAKAVNFQYKEDLLDYFEDGILCKGLDKFSINAGEFLEFCKAHTTIYMDNFAGGTYDLPLDDLISFSAKTLPLWNGSFKELCEDIDSVLSPKSTFVILSGTEKSGKNLAKSLSESGYKAQYSKDLKIAEKGRVYVLPGTLSVGFEYPETAFYLVSFGQNIYKPKKRQRANKQGQQIYSLSELSKGDYVVHSTHGIGVFEGINKMEVQGVTKDYIKISYAKGDALYVPVTQLDLVAKYIGPKEDSRVKVSRLGGTEWQKAKTRVKSAVKDMAKELIVLYTERMKATGYAFSPDNEWQRDFELKFPYEETPDQLRCVDEIKGDMERLAPMDRLLCGDVGFGKTEVALRAIFKCVTDSKQCAFLCPTTILAWQHYQTLLSRFDGYPIRIELLSRFRTPKQQKEIIAKLKRGEIDVVIGTHRLVQKDVGFRDLGLVVIDEEQRFGVAQKERFKEISKNVDALTLSATPIPRTLNMAMSGIRDMSVIEQAPQNRHPVQTYVMEFDKAVINEAIRRELRRGGQVFYLHNVTESITSKAAQIQREIPEARVAVGHGRMAENELSEVWRQMLEQEINVLVCTTIIETGVDLPNANTLIIENADRMGLSQLHQIRGRVGRSARRAYAYFTYKPQKVLSDISQKRLRAIKEFTEFGSGYKIAMRDLELRGAGNILGGQQHGHMEDVGYDMYLKLLGDAVREEKGEKTISNEIDCTIDIQMEAHIPETYIENLSLRLDAYKRIADIRNDDDYSDVSDELNDRYGKIPQSVIGLLDIALIRNKAYACGIYEIKQNDTGLLLYINDIKEEAVYDIIGKQKGNAMLSAGNKPYIAVRVPKGKNTVNALKEIFM